MQRSGLGLQAAVKRGIESAMGKQQLPGAAAGVAGVPEMDRTLGAIAALSRSGSLSEPQVACTEGVYRVICVWCRKIGWSRRR